MDLEPKLQVKVKFEATFDIFLGGKGVIALVSGPKWRLGDSIGTRVELGWILGWEYEPELGLSLCGKVSSTLSAKLGASSELGLSLCGKVGSTLGAKLGALSRLELCMGPRKKLGNGFGILLSAALET